MKLQVNVNLTYPYDPEFKYETILERINLDEERKRDLQKGKGFIVCEPQGIKKDIKDYNGIFSTRFGQTLQDVNPYAHKHSCECKNLQGAIYDGIECPICHTKVRWVGEEMDFFGWIVLDDPYYLIHPNLYKTIEFIIGTKYLNNILKYNVPKDENGHPIIGEPKPKNEPYFGIGMMEFKDKFEEIMAFYIKLKPAKMNYYEDLMAAKDMVFIQSIPVYTTHLRPFRVDGNNLYFEEANEVYQNLSKLAATCNRREMEMTKRARRPKNDILWLMQQEYNKLEKMIEESLAKKKGQIRSLFGGRYGFSSRCVIASDPELRSWQIRLPYKALVELYQQTIINILHRSHSIPYDAAWKIWYRSKIKFDKRVYDILDGLIKDSVTGLPMFINRPPTIQYGSTLFMRCVGINKNYTMSVPLEVLPLLAGDFDGDALSILSIINKAIERAGEEVFSPRYSMHISRNDGMYNNDINHQKDIIIAACGLIGTARKNYTPEMLAIINQAKNMQDDVVRVGDRTVDMLNTNTAKAMWLPNDQYREFSRLCQKYANIYESHWEGH